MFSSSAGQLASGLTGNSGSPYEEAMKQYQQYAGKAEGTQNPFLEYGKAGMPLFQNWLQGMQNPSGFINNQMNNYQESPYAQFQQQQGLRAAQNMGSASGLTGSTPLMMQAQQNAQNISSQDMNQWLQNVLGINSQYGAGLNNQIQTGQGAANQLTGLYGDMGRQMGEAAYGQAAGQNQDKSNIWGGLLGMAGTVAGSMFGGPMGGMAGGAIGSSLGGMMG